jgi:Family of unknown function (DUF5690)
MRRLSLNTRQSTFNGSHRARIAAQLTVASFVAYFCMYAFRKPFAVAQYSSEFWLGSHIQLKTALVVSQLIGYATSKFLGIRWCSSANRRTRAAWLIGCIAVSEVALILFAVVPASWKPVAMFINGLPLGMIWGFVVAYLEGRRAFEILIAGLSCSFILSSGVVKDIGASVLQRGASEMWMPAAVGAGFLVPFLLAVWFLERVPNPSSDDIASRVHRVPMAAADRRRFLKSFGFTLAPLILLYLLLSAFRDYRDSYGIEIFQALGYLDQSGLFTRSEIPVALGVFAALMLLSAVHENQRALVLIYTLMTAGIVILGAVTLLHLQGVLGGFAWMVLIGLGSYLAYAPFGAILFDRLIAASRSGGNAIYAIYLADSIAYLGVVAVQLQHDLFMPGMSRLDFLRNGSLVISLLGVPLLALSAISLSRKLRVAG